MPMLPDWSAYCLTRPGAREDYPFGPSPLVMKAGGKMFALLSESGGTVQLSLKCEPEWALVLREKYASVRPGWHLNKKHWNTVADDGSVPEEEIRQMIDESYQLVVRSLTKAERSKLTSAEN